MRHLGTIMLTAFLTSLAGCAADAGEPTVSVYATHVVETVATGESLETVVYDRDRREILATLVRSDDTGLTEVDEPGARRSKRLDTGIPVDGGDLDAYNAFVSSTWTRTQQIRGGAVPYGQCGAGWSQWIAPDGWWGHCCANHDGCYGQGGYEPERERCDNDLRHCINAVWGPGDTYFYAVRAFGRRYFFYWPSEDPQPLDGPDY
jgi:hypothetical protein